jgi:hypothetical protein
MPNGVERSHVSRIHQRPERFFDNRIGTHAQASDAPLVSFLFAGNMAPKKSSNRADAAHNQWCQRHDP